MTKEEILDYVMSTPDNTNRRVLNDMIDELVNSQPSGGSGVFWVTLERTEEDDGFTSDKTFSEIFAAIRAGQNVMARTIYNGTDPNNEIDHVHSLERWQAPGEESGYIQFGHCDVRFGTVNYNYITINSNNEVSDYYNTYPDDVGF